MAGKAIDWIKAQKAIYPDKPFFIYWAPGATHAPHHVPAEWIEKYKGQVRRRLGSSCASEPSPGRRNWASSPPMPS